MIKVIAEWISDHPNLDKFFSHFKWYNETCDLLLRLWEDDC
jgi:hypothetical protein